MDHFSMRTLDTPLTPDSSASSSDSEDTPTSSRRPSRFVRESVMNAIIYNQGRRRGSQETEVTLRQQYEDLDQKYLVDIESEREEQKRTVDRIKTDHRTEATMTSLTAKQHIDEARRGMLKYQAALKIECELSARKINALASMHEQERQQMKEAHDYKVDHLYTKISKLAASQTDGRDAVLRDYESSMEQKQKYIETLEKKLRYTEERLEDSESQKHKGQGSFGRENERPAARANEWVTGMTMDRQERAPVMDQPSLVQQLQRTNSEQASLILGLQASLSNLGRQLTEARAAQAQAYPGQSVPVYTMTHPPYREGPANTFTPPPMTYPQQTLQQANGTNAQHAFPQTSQSMNPAGHNGMWNPTPPPSHEQSWQPCRWEGAKGNHISQGSIAKANR
ncbi:hypothetical protein XANCAGTX0491_003498 [Xanthoria calcicola]